MPRRKREKKKAMTSAERQAKWRLSHSKVNDVLSPPTLLLACHPNGKIDLDELEGSAAKTMELYNKLRFKRASRQAIMPKWSCAARRPT